MNTQSKLLLALAAIVIIYIGIAFLAPITMKFGMTNIGNGIYQIYERFCHQRVERSIFLFGRNSFYSVADLKNEGYLPPASSTNSYPEYFGHDFNGNNEIGYKVAVCIRDVGLYLAFALTLIFIAFKKNLKYGYTLPIVFVIPIFLDVAIQLVIEFNRLGGNYLLFENDLTKRIVTGVLAGIGCALLLQKVLENGLTNQEKIGNI